MALARARLETHFMALMDRQLVKSETLLMAVMELIVEKLGNQHIAIKEYLASPLM